MNLSRKIEITANVATIIVGLLLTVILIERYLVPHPAPATASVSGLARGSSVDGRPIGVDWKKNHQTLVLAISTTCHFCKDSVPFYRRLGGIEKSVKMVAVLPQSVSEGKEYLEGKGVRVDDIRQVQLNTVGVKATPTLLLVNDVGVVTNIWVGKLPPEQETEVLTAVEKKAFGD